MSLLKVFIFVALFITSANLKQFINEEIYKSLVIYFTGYVHGKTIKMLSLH